MTFTSDKKMKNENGFLKKLNKIIPLRMIVPLLSVLVTDLLCYYGAMFLRGDSSYHVLLSSIDDRITYLPWMVYIYFLSFPYWFYLGMLVARQKDDNAYQVITAYHLTIIIALIIFIIWPLWIIRPEVETGGLTGELNRFLQKIDHPTNLFPSLHCAFSFQGFIGIAWKKELPLWKRIACFVFMIFVFGSTVHLKQHYLIDVFGGIFLAALTDFICRVTPLYKKTKQFWNFISEKLHLLKEV